MDCTQRRGVAKSKTKRVHSYWSKRNRITEASENIRHALVKIAGHSEHVCRFVAKARPPLSIETGVSEFFQKREGLKPVAEDFEQENWATLRK